jgi:arsenate reductase (glutaredoxin)
MSITIYHNPACGTSRNTLAILKQSGAHVRVIEYLVTPPDRETLVGLIASMGGGVRAAMRTNVPPFEQLGLADPGLSDDALIDAMMLHPILINRPIVVSPKGTKLCRPCEAVLDLLDNPNIGPFTKEDGEVVIDAHGTRVRPAKV